jgi:mannose-6-phosphate isomerase-like protein (cupin superfamily)
MESANKQSVFDIREEMATLPKRAETMLADKYFTDKESASSRIFRIYRELPLHYHRDCDEYLYIVSGSGLFHLDGIEYEAYPGMFLCFERRRVHGFPRVEEHPLVVLSIDVPRRRPDDIVFIDSDWDDATTFMARNAK